MEGRRRNKNLSQERTKFVGIGNLPIKSSETIALDTNIFIYASGKTGKIAERATALLEKIKEESPRVFVSVIVIEEFFVKIYKERLENETPILFDFVTAGGLITIVDVNRDIALRAAKIRAEYNVKAPDALHLATALHVGATTFITADRGAKRKIEGLIIKLL